MGEKKEQLNIRIPKEELEDLKREAKRRNDYTAELARKILREKIKEYKDERRTAQNKIEN